MPFDLPFSNSRSDWNVKSLVELCGPDGGIQTGPFGSQLHAADYVERGIPSIMPMNITVEGVDETGIARVSEADAKRLSRHLVAEGDIVYSRRGDVEKCTLITEREAGWLCGTGCLRVRLGEKAEISPAFLHAYLSHPSVRRWIAQRAIGATMPNLNTGILSALPVLIPDRATWENIGLFWRQLILKQNLNRRMNNTLGQVVQAIFKSWFVDFGPVRAKVAAKAEGLDPLRAAMCAISGKTDIEIDDLPRKQFARLAATAALFPSDLVESDLGEIPQGWEVTELGRLCSRISMGPFGSDIKRENFIASGVPLIRGGNLTDGLVEDGYAYVSEEKADQLRNANAYPEDIVITHRGLSVKWG